MNRPPGGGGEIGPGYDILCLMDESVMERLDAALGGNYEIERKLGEGGMATVYLAEDLKHKRKVAIKVLKPELAAVVGSERFLAEIETTARLQHPHILPLFDSGEADRFLFYVMPYVEGESLRDRLDRERQLPVDEAVRIAAQLADALDHAHRQGVVHRDIKPANAMLNEGSPVLTDFGIALAVGEAGGGRLTETGLSVGTPLYMSPEQATDYEHVGPPADVYALGCVLYEMLVGEPPYTGSTPQAILGRIMTGSFEPPRARRPTVPANVDAAVRKALEKVPADRFASARDFADALTDPSFRHGEPEDVIGSPGTWRFAAAAGWGLAAILAALFAWSLLRSPAGDGEAALRYGSLLFPEGAVVPDDVTQPIDVSTDGTRVAYVLEREGRRELHVRRLDEPSGTHLAQAGSAVGSFTFSPDGRWIAYYDIDESEIRKVPVEGGPAGTLGSVGRRGGSSDVQGIAWGPDGDLVFAADGLMSLSENGGTPRALTTPDAERPVQHAQPSFVPDGSGVVFTIRSLAYPYHHEVNLLRFGGEPAVLTEGHSPRVTSDGILVFGQGGRVDGAVWAVPLDDDFAALVGEPVRLFDGLRMGDLTGGRAFFDIASDGTMIHLPFRIPRSDALVWVDREGRAQEILTLESEQLPRDVSYLAAARISPEGGRIAFRGSGGGRDYRLFVYDLGRRVVTPLPVDANADWPLWAPDGARIVFNGFAEGRHDLYWIRADGVGRAEPLEPTNEYQRHPLAFTSDGSGLLVQHRAFTQARNSDLLLLSLEGDREPEGIVATEASEYQGALSPDGRWLAYVSDASGSPEVYVTDFPAARTRIKVSAGGGFSPLWGRHGDELLYRRVGDGAVVTVGVSTEAAFAAGVPEVLFEGGFSTCCVWGRTFEVAPDGERFLMIRETHGGVGPPRLEVVQQWMAEVRRRLEG